jgi:hypothetical protein
LKSLLLNSFCSVEAEFETKQKEMKVRHEAEITAVSDGGTEEVDAGNDDDQNESAAVQLSPEQVAAAAEEERQRLAKEKLGVKREKARAKERQKVQDIKDENAAAGPAARDVEMQIIQSKLPEGWRMEEVAADGHCLYRAIAAQHSDSSYANMRTYPSLINIWMESRKTHFISRVFVLLFVYLLL